MCHISFLSLNVFWATHRRIFPSHNSRCQRNPLIRHLAMIRNYTNSILYQNNFLKICMTYTFKCPASLWCTHFFSLQNGQQFDLITNKNERKRLNDAPSHPHIEYRQKNSFSFSLILITIKIRRIVYSTFLHLFILMFWGINEQPHRFSCVHWTFSSIG